MIYLDNSATTKMDEAVLDAMLPWLRDHYGNASSAHGLGRQARVAVESAREEIASYLNAHPAELIFTSGGTESNNAIIKSCMIASDLVDRFAHSSVEHHSVLAVAESLHKLDKPIHCILVDENGFVQTDQLSYHNHPRTLVSVMHANNETGLVQNLTALRAMLPEALIHSDMVQSFAKIPIDMQVLGIDFASFSAHKLHGPKGIGAMFIKRGIDFKAQQKGGGQERNRRAGTEAVALIVGFQVAARLAFQNFRRTTEQCVQQIQKLREELLRLIPQVRINTPVEHSLPHVLNISFEDAEQLDGDAILQLLDVQGIACSNGSACVSGSMQPSHVLLAMGRSKEEARAAVRFSISRFTTDDELLQAAQTVADIVREMRNS